MTLTAHQVPSATMVPAHIADIGPLPESDRNAELRRISITVLKSFLEHNDELIIWREEPVEDYGVDGSLEAKIGKGMTNFRSQAQVKGTDRPRVNIDGTISLSVRTSNLNHLLNGVCPMYILYVHPTGELWFVWARDEQQRLQVDCPNWIQQETVTLRLARKLTADAVPKIRDRIVAEGRLGRQIYDSLARTTVGESICLRIEAETLKSLTPDKAQAVLAASGATIVGSGFPDEAIRLFNLLPVEAQLLPRFQLVCGYAHYTRGRFRAASGFLAEARARAELMNASDRDLLARLENACDHRMGVIDTETCLSRARKLDESTTGSESLITRFEAARRAVMGEREPNARAKLRRELRSLVHGIMADKSNPASLCLHAKLCLLHLDGTDAALAINCEYATLEIRARLGLSGGAGSVKEAMHGFQQWEEETERAHAEAVRIGHPVLMGEALTIRLGVHTVFLHWHRLSAASSAEQFTVDPAFAGTGRAEGSEAIGIFHRAGVLEEELRAKMALADFEEVCGDLPTARALAREILPVAKAMEYPQLVVRAEAIIEGKTLLASSLANRAVDHDVSYAQASDEDVRGIADTAVLVMKLPRDRTPAMEREHFALREAAKVRVHWCKYLMIVQEDPEGHFQRLLHMPNPPTPSLACACMKYRYQSKMAYPDIDAVVKAFKGVYCVTCMSRTPKVAGRATPQPND